MIVVGSKVRIKLHKPDEWNAGCAAVVQGAVGVVEEVKVHPWSKGNRYLVGFDPPLPKIYSNGMPLTGMHFEREDLIEVEP